ncbi:hypothetical protein [Streptomyces sp. NPDC004783]|uniref:hypothetical protein n=1 Tax=Streptomyces sp. NPDC004783 TaxID=3154459 RepID=UPI0033B0EAC2
MNGKNGKWNSGRLGRWVLGVARCTAALLCAYVPLAGQLPAPLLPAPLLNVLALLTALPVLLPAGPGDRLPQGAPTHRSRPAIRGRHPGCRHGVRPVRRPNSGRTGGPTRPRRAPRPPSWPLRSRPRR